MQNEHILASDDRSMERAFILRLIRQSIAANTRIYSAMIVDDWERWGDFYMDRRNAFPIVQRILNEMQDDGELKSELVPPPSNQGMARRWYEMVE